MRAYPIKKEIFWVGAIDSNLQKFHGYRTDRGTTYNAYLILDEKITLIDTVKEGFSNEMIERISTIIDPKKIDYVVCNHVEMDHSGALPALMEICPSATIVASPMGVKGLKEHFFDGWNYKEVKTADTLRIGKRNLHFFQMPMVHWPDSMATYVEEDTLLLPNDAFGQHMASSLRFDDEIGWDIVKEEAAKYYANIVLPFGQQVEKALLMLQNISIDMIAPAHGLIYRSHVQDILSEYKKWAENQTEKKGVIIYDTMWKSTEKMADAVRAGFDRKGIPVRMLNIQAHDISDLMLAILDSEYICIGSPTFNRFPLPTIVGFFSYMKGLQPKGRKMVIFGSYGWHAEGLSYLEKELNGMTIDLLDTLKVQYVPSKEDLEEMKKRVEKVL